MACCTLDTIKTPDGPRYYMRQHCGARYRDTSGQHYVVDGHGSLRQCDAQGRIQPRLRMSKKARRRLQCHPKR